MKELILLSEELREVYDDVNKLLGDKKQEDAAQNG